MLATSGEAKTIRAVKSSNVVTGASHTQAISEIEFSINPSQIAIPSRYSEQQLREKWEICIRAGFFNSIIALNVSAFIWLLPSSGTSSSP
ncbi:hypothetical protein TNCV_3242351 [Trichonephila clavipes]|nr:hypothetical protein TNCV_3242351 [Trichonephila clavipes]